MKKFNVNLSTITEGYYPAWGECENVEIEVDSHEDLETIIADIKHDFIHALIANNSDYSFSNREGYDIAKRDIHMTVETYAEEIEE